MLYWQQKPVKFKYQYKIQGTTKTVTFILIGDVSFTSYLVAADLNPNNLSIDKTYMLTKVWSKTFNRSTTIFTSVDTNISISTIVKYSAHIIHQIHS